MAIAWCYCGCASIEPCLNIGCISIATAWVRERQERDGSSQNFRVARILGKRAGSGGLLQGISSITSQGRKVREEGEPHRLQAGSPFGNDIEINIQLTHVGGKNANIVIRTEYSQIHLGRSALLKIQHLQYLQKIWTAKQLLRWSSNETSHTIVE
ncbi:hypothetical protein VNO77_02376 [Canavalia gladiata]|uniref:Uncharacterized protein n=1 Tax=Canavalia gladiata TaxID=3824 RepID=A0AAN9MUY4_CANGL